MKDAELVLAVFDGTREPDDDDKALLSELQLSGACVIPVINKCDAWGEKSPMAEAIADSGFDNAIGISAASGEGIDALMKLVDDKFTDGEIDLRYDAVVADARQYASLLQASESLSATIDEMQSGYELDVCCIDAEGAMNALGEINGHHVGEDIVSSIFHKFCVGK
jgi:tRNA modification GTPase